jgi:hypothetical protein
MLIFRLLVTYKKRKKEGFMKSTYIVITALAIMSSATIAYGQAINFKDLEDFYRRGFDYQGTCSCRWVQVQCGPVRRGPTNNQLYDRPGATVDMFGCYRFQRDFEPVYYDGIMFRVQCTLSANWEIIPRSNPTRFRELRPPRNIVVPLEPLPDPNAPVPEFGSAIKLNANNNCLVSM